MAEFCNFFWLKIGSDLSFIIPEKTSHLGSAKTSQGTYLIFDKIQLKPSKIDSILVFFAITFIPIKKISKLLASLTTYDYTDLGQEEFQKLWSTFRDTLFAGTCTTLLK